MGREKWSSLVWLGLAIFICIGSVKLSLGTLQDPGPGFLSFSAGAVLGVLAFTLHLQSRKSPPAAKSAKPFWNYRDRGLKMVMSVFALLAYAVGMEYLGFLVSTAIFLAFFLRVIEPRRWPVVIFLSVFVSGVSYLIFGVWLDAQLPKGPFQIF